MHQLLNCVRFKLSCLAATLLLVSCLPRWAEAQNDSGFKFIEVTVTSPEDKPLKDVEVDIKMGSMQFPMQTNAEGKISLNVPSDGSSKLKLSVMHPDFVGEVVNLEGKTLPEEYTIKLVKGVLIGGIVHNQEGQSIEGVRVSTSKLEVSPSKTVTLHPMSLAITNEGGRWKANVKYDPTKPLPLNLSHEDFVKNSSYKQLATWEQLKQLDHILVLEKGIELRGRVTDTQGEPIVGASVTIGKSRYHVDRKNTLTDEAGIYQFSNVNPGFTVVTVATDTHAPDLTTVQVRKGIEAVDFQLEQGQTIKFLVTDVDDVPIAGANVTADEWRGHRSLPEKFYRGDTNAEGVIQFNNMPAEVVQFDLYKRGHMSSRNNMITARDEPYTIVLPWPLVVTGNIVDAQTGTPIEKFNVVQGIDWGNPNQSMHWERHRNIEGVGGEYRTEFTYPRAGHYVRIEADGYRPAVSRMILDGEGEVTIDFELEIGVGPSGIVKNPDGKPAVGVQLFVATREERLYIRNGRNENNRGKPHTTTDEQGKYTLPFFESPFALVCLHENGWARLPDKQVESSSDIQLQAWSIVEGIALAGNQPLAEEQIRIHFNEPYVQNAPQVYWDYQTKSDGVGNFKFDRVIDKEGVVSRRVKYGDRGDSWRTANTHSEQVKLKPGLTAKVRLGGTGRGIKGRLKVPEDYGGAIPWDMSVVQFSEQSQSANAKNFFHALGKAIGQATGGRSAPQKPSFRRSYASAIDVDGNFAVVDMLPGQYQMQVQLYPPPNSDMKSWQQIGNLSESITIPENNGAKDQDPLNLGEYTLKMIQPQK